jgi:membrane-bound lytic murein transglycosylase
MFIRLNRSLRWFPAIALTAVLPGCASTDPVSKAPTPRQDFQEYRRLVVSGIGQLDATLRALDNLSAQANRDARPAYEAFAQAVQRLEVDSIKVREHTQAMRTRGDAYFEHWQEWLAESSNEGVRQRAAQHQEELKRSFEAVRAAAQQVRDGFRPFLTDVQKLCAVLDQEPTLAHIDAQKNLILAADEKGRQVQESLERILAEMNTMSALLRAPDATAKH